MTLPFRRCSLTLPSLISRNFASTVYFPVASVHVRNLAAVCEKQGENRLDDIAMANRKMWREWFMRFSSVSWWARSDFVE